MSKYIAVCWDSMTEEVGTMYHDTHEIAISDEQENWADAEFQLVNTVKRCNGWTEAEYKQPDWRGDGFIGVMVIGPIKDKLEVKARALDLARIAVKPSQMFETIGE